MSAVPYPADTRAKGWRFELDHERVRQSDTWALTPATHRPWLLMLWMVAWEQTPCGSLPDDDELICARLEMDVDTFAKAKRFLLRSWRKAEDGRLYHPVLIERVLEMLERKEKDRTRKALYRDRMDALRQGGAAMSRGTGADGRVGDDTGTSTGTSTSSPDGEDVKRAARAGSKVSKIWLTIAQMQAGNDDLTAETADQYLKYRRGKRAPLTELAWKGIVAEIRKTGRPIDWALAYAMSRGWTGFEFAWLSQERRNAPQQGRAGRQAAALQELDDIINENLGAAAPQATSGEGHGPDDRIVDVGDRIVDVDARRVD